MGSVIAFCILLVCCAQTVRAQVRSVPSDFATIQAAIDASVAGDTVLIDDGTYIENIDFRGKAIVVGSRFIVDGDTSHIAATVIDGSQPLVADTASTVRFVSGEDSTSVLSGLTITGGTGTLVDSEARAGGGILCVDSAPRLSNLRVESNVLNASFVVGAGIGCRADTPTSTLILEDLRVSGNSAIGTDYAAGAGIITEGLDVKLVRSEITGNTARGDSGVEGGGAHFSGTDDVSVTIVVDECVLAENLVETSSPSTPSGAGGLFLGNASFKVTNTGISGNTVRSAQGGGAGIAHLSNTTQDGANLFSSNVVENNVCDGYNCVGGGAVIIGSSGLSIVDNRFAGNETQSAGGGLAVIDGEATLQRNLIVGNSASEAAGGIWLEHTVRQQSDFDGSLRSSFEQLVDLVEDVRSEIRSAGFASRATSPGQTAKTSSRKHVLVNNTIVENTTQGLGPGVFTVLASPQILNSIIWGNISPNPNQIAGGAAVSYSLVENGYAGEGNLDADPMFADQVDFLLTPGSPAVDAGHPDSTYYDPEDPGNPGQAMPPSFGTVHNDMGAYGGPADPVAPSVDFLGPNFGAFMSRLDAVSYPDRAAIADSFFEAAGSLPYVEDNGVVYFIYRENASSIHIAGDFNGWQDGIHPMKLRSDVVFWYREEVFESDARLDYKFIRNGGEWILDPNNPNTVEGGFGPNSELAMPAYVQPEEIVQRPEVPRGARESFEMTSAILGNSRQVYVHLPAEYESSPAVHYPLVFFHDGTDYLNFAAARTVLDNLIADEQIVPLIGVFVPPVEREEEYAFSKTIEYERFVIEELMPEIDSRYRTRLHPKARAMTGPSLGGLITTQICYNHPEVFGLCAPFSPSYWVNDGALMEEILTRESTGAKAGILKDIHWYLDWGTYEVGIATTGSQMAAGLEDLGYNIVWNEWPEGHSWGSWRAHLDEFLELWFAPGAIVASEGELIPEQSMLTSAYPNPFSDRATIRFGLDGPGEVRVEVFDVTGRLVATPAFGRESGGVHQVEWRPSSLASGVYLIRLDTGERTETIKLVYRGGDRW